MREEIVDVWECGDVGEVGGGGGVFGGFVGGGAGRGECGGRILIGVDEFGEYVLCE